VAFPTQQIALTWENRVEQVCMWWGLEGLGAWKGKMLLLKPLN